MKTFMKVNAVVLAVGIVLMIAGFATLRVNWHSYSADSVSYEETVSAEDWNNAVRLKIDVGFASLHIMKGKTVKLFAEEVPEPLAAHLTAEGDTISLKSDTVRGKDLIKSSGASIDSAGTYTLYIPDYIENIDVDFSFGELKITDIYAKNADIAIAYSNSELCLGVTDSLSIDTSFGNTDIDLLTRECREFRLSSGFGDCDIMNARISGSADIDNSFGDMDIKLLGDNYHIDSDNAFGDSSVNGSRSDGKIRINVSNAFGDIDVYTDDVPEFLID